MLECANLFTIWDLNFNQGFFNNSAKELQLLFLLILKSHGQKWGVSVSVQSHADARSGVETKAEMTPLILNKPRIIWWVVLFQFTLREAQT
jgi:hypothetical protein